MNLEILPRSYVRKYFLYSKFLIRAIIKIWYSARKNPKCLSKHINFPKFIQHHSNTIPEEFGSRGTSLSMESLMKRETKIFKVFRNVCVYVYIFEILEIEIDWNILNGPYNPPKSVEIILCKTKNIQFFYVEPRQDKEENVNYKVNRYILYMSKIIPYICMYCNKLS